MGLGGPFARPLVAAFATDDDAANYHLLNRLSYGVRPADMARVKRVGRAAYIEEQLNPAKLLRGVSLPVSSIMNVPRARLAKVKNSYDVAYRSLILSTVNRMFFSPAQLSERVVEFWSDHFNVAAEDEPVDFVDWQRTVIRKYAFGKFRDLLRATAQHPSMLVYLDNFLNIAAHPNENYARELMELHTLGVDGGYTEADVKAVARAFTGWTFDYNREGEGFFFNADDHDADEKTVLGQTLPAGRGIEDGLDVIALLANHSSTRHFVCRKLAVRFVSDNPAATLVNALAQVWADTDGAIVPILRTLFNSPEFAAARGQKLRRPLDFAVGLMRLGGVRIRKVDDFVYFCELLGQVPFGWHPPNGFPDNAGAWANSNGVLSRWNVATTFLEDAQHGSTTGMKTAIDAVVGQARTVGEFVDKAALALLAQPLDADVRARLVQLVAPGGTGDTRLTGAVRRGALGSLAMVLVSSPNFQWR